LNDGTIDIIVSAHAPQDEESKNIEFDMADFGVIGLQTVLPILVQLHNKVDLATLIEKITVAPRARLNLDVPQIKEGAKANLTLFDPTKSWTLNDKTNKSKSKNSPFYNKTLTGKVKGVFNQGKFLLEENISQHI